MLDVHIAPERPPDGRRHRGPAGRVAPLRRPRGGRRSGRVHRIPGEAGARRRRRRGTPATASGSMGVYIFDTDVLVRELRATPRSDSSHDFGKDVIPRLVSAGSASTRTCSGTRTRRRPSTGATSARSTPTSRRRWTSSRSTRSSTSTTPSGRCGRTSRSFRPPSSCSPTTAGAAMRSSPSCRSGCIVSGSRRPALDPVPQRPGPLLSATSRTRSCMPNAVIHRHSRDPAGHHRPRRRDPRTAPSIGYDPAEDRRRHTVSEGGVVVVTPGEECYVDPTFASSLRL